MSPVFLNTLIGSCFALSFVGGLLVVLATLVFFKVVLDFFLVVFAVLSFTFGAFFSEGSFFVVTLVFLDLLFVVIFLEVDFLVVFGVTFLDGGFGVNSSRISSAVLSSIELI